ncbi:MAG: helix-turn-helix transcriptional regulator [Chloroflexota bacterium]|nr:helix-turn-helix transcriptional regulator [Chloroflexota bacterium]
MAYRRELLKGSMETMLLSLLKQEPMYGYQIIKETDKRSRGYFKFKEGTLYPALHRLEHEGLISGVWRRLPTGQERRYYHITKKGLSLLEEEVTEWQSFSAAMSLVIRPVLP